MIIRRQNVFAGISTIFLSVKVYQSRPFKWEILPAYFRSIKWIFLLLWNNKYINQLVSIPIGSNNFKLDSVFFSFNLFFIQKIQVLDFNLQMNSPKLFGPVIRWWQTMHGLQDFGHGLRGKLGIIHQLCNRKNCNIKSLLVAAAQIWG